MFSNLFHELLSCPFLVSKHMVDLRDIILLISDFLTMCLEIMVYLIKFFFILVETSITNYYFVNDCKQHMDILKECVVSAFFRALCIP